MLLMTLERSSKYHTMLTNEGRFGKSSIPWFTFSHLVISCWHCAACKLEKFTYFLGKDIKFYGTLQWSSITNDKFLVLHFPVSFLFFFFFYSGGQLNVQIYNLNIEVATWLLEWKMLDNLKSKCKNELPALAGMSITIILPSTVVSIVVCTDST